MLQWKIGNVTVSRIVELEAPTSPRFLFGRSKQDVLGIEWLRPHFVTETGLMILSIHALVVESEGRKIIVDTCLGNDKERKIPGWSMLKGSFLEDLAEAGFPRESFDTVMCTHLHVDHVGWNTMLVDGKWAPTFPNARYLFARQEWEYWSQNEQDEFPRDLVRIRTVERPNLHGTQLEGVVSRAGGLSRPSNVRDHNRR